MKIDLVKPYLSNLSINQQQNKVNSQSVQHPIYNRQNTYSTPILALNYFTNNISFTGDYDWDAINEFTYDMGKRIYSKRNVHNLYLNNPEADGITAGRGLPEVWLNRIENIDEFDKDEFMQEFGKIFASERKVADGNKLNERLTNLFRKHKIIDENTPLKVGYIGHGFQAWAYKISIGENDQNEIVTKLFKRHNNYLQNHGNYTEQNLAEYIKNYAGDKSEFTKYYYGDTKNGIMLVDFVPSDREPKQVVQLDLEDIGIGYKDDFPKNRINGIICDFGGIETISNLVGNRSAQDVYSKIKYAKTDEEKLEIFNNIYSEKENTDEFKDKAIGLVHGIKFMPEDLRPDLYCKCYDIGSHRVNIALIQNIKNFSRDEKLKDLTNKLMDNAYKDVKELETISKEIAGIPQDLQHRFFNEQQNTRVSAIIKYLSRKINLYYKDMGKRQEIYETFIENADTYASIALINSMHYMGKRRYDEYFEKFFAKNDSIVNTTLARSVELMNFDPKLQEKWIDKLLAYNNVDVTTGLCETVAFIDENLQEKTFEKLLHATKDRVAREFLAQNITSIPNFSYHKEWFKELWNSDDMIKGALMKSINNIKYDFTKNNILSFLENN